MLRDVGARPVEVVPSRPSLLGPSKLTPLWPFGSLPLASRSPQLGQSPPNELVNSQYERERSARDGEEKVSPHQRSSAEDLPSCQLPKDHPFDVRRRRSIFVWRPAQKAIQTSEKGLHPSPSLATSNYSRISALAKTISELARGRLIRLQLAARAPLQLCGGGCTRTEACRSRNDEAACSGSQMDRQKTSRSGLF